MYSFILLGKFWINKELNYVRPCCTCIPIYLSTRRNQFGSFAVNFANIHCTISLARYNIARLRIENYWIVIIDQDSAIIIKFIRKLTIKWIIVVIWYMC